MTTEKPDYDRYNDEAEEAIYARHFAGGSLDGLALLGLVVGVVALLVAVGFLIGSLF
jgi:hypothetical protein